MSQPFLKIQPLWQDKQIVEIQASARSGSFAGATKVYTTYEALREFARGLVGFPRSPTSQHGFDSGEDAGDGSFAVAFSCSGGSGRVGVTIAIRDHSEEVRLNFIVEPGAIDTFCSDLSAMCKRESGVAELVGGCV